MDRLPLALQHRELLLPAGIEGTHEKGGADGMIGYFRRNNLTPVPEADSLAKLNEMVDQWDLHDGHRRIGSRP
ncbi:hypothetical protein [Streptomyces sp. NPDC048196]|uniref:hypothetical protein n=1 Tax=Streptomyces sp. NPDC048196 TaxID=3154712 RepID=UPI0033FA8E9D